MIDESLEGVDRASSIVRDVKGLAHSGRGQRQLADPNALLDGVLRMAAPQLRATAVVELSPTGQHSPRPSVSMRLPSIPPVSTSQAFTASARLEASVRL